MNLKRDIIVRNEFSVPTVGTSGRRGTRGGTPGDYVLRYMARDNATESLAPIRRLRTDDFIQRYMAREEATESLDVTSVPGLKRKMSKGQGQGGVAFGYGQVSLSHDALKAASRNIQELFDSGHTVMKTVLSFDGDYLKKHKIVPKGFQFSRRGDYRGQIDQMKLRLAIMHGLDRMGRTMYDDLRYVAVIQVDTANVHCHLAMVDAGSGTLAPDGTQKGKISSRARSVIRRGIDSWLDEKQQVKHLSSAVGYERRNVTTYVKRWAHQQMLRESLPQFLLACLPEDRRQWRYATNAKAMQKPNRIVQEMVEEVLEQPGSPYPEAMARVQSYANHRRKSEGLSKPEWDRIVDQGRQRIIERSVNGVYALLRGLPEDSLRVKTPMLDVMGLDYEDIALKAAKRSQRRTVAQTQAQQDQDLVGFGFRLRSYSSRLKHHTEQREKYHQLSRTWEEAEAIGAAAPESRAVYSFYQIEEDYHARVAAKYRSLLNFLPASDDWQAEIDEVSQYGERLMSLSSLRKDQSLRKMKDPQKAEALGRDIYGQNGGALMSLGDKDSLAELDRRIAAMRARYEAQIENLRVSLYGKGLRLQQRVPDDVSTDPVIPTLEVAIGPEFPFEEVKALDLHHMKFDFARDVEVGERGRRNFMEWSQLRKSSLEAAMQYLEQSDQQEAIHGLPTTDIRQMAELAAEYQSGKTALPSEVYAIQSKKEVVRRSKTTKLDVPLRQQLEARVIDEARSSVDELQAMETPTASEIPTQSDGELV